MTKIGIYDPYLATFGGGENYVSVLAAALSDGFEVDLLSPQHIEKTELEEKFNVDLKKVNYVYVPEFVTAQAEEIRSDFGARGYLSKLTELAKLSSTITKNYDIFFHLVNFYPCYSSAKRSILLVQFPFPQLDVRFSDFPSIYRKSLFALCRMAQWFYRRRNLTSYDKIFCNSQFTRRWVKIRWKRDSQVIYPPIDVELFKPLPKKNYIISVGRFFPGYHNKKHIEMVRMFREICDEGLDGWEFHIVGNVSSKAEDKDYLVAVEKEASGYPIFIHPNLPLEKLRKLYGQSSIFWHATGLDEDENIHPEKFEHFGMTTVEAMAAGCVPIVIDKAGQKEIVANAENGFLWQDRKEWKEQTLRVISDNSLRARLAEKAIQRSKDFSRDAFAKRVIDIVSSL